MPLVPLDPFIPADEHTVSPNQDIPKDEMDIFYRTETAFLPEGKTWDDLTDVEKAEIRAKYRFDPLRPGTYQGITGFGKMIS
jgi:hypothetical protein